VKVGLNATCINDRPSGARQRFVGIYGELIKRLPDTEFVVYEPADCRVASWFHGAANVSARATPLPSEGRLPRLLGGLRYWRPELTRQRFDLFEGLNLPLVTAPTGRTLLTIHDIRGVHPDCALVERTIFSQVLRRSLAAADHVIAVSATIKQEILAFHPGIPVSVVYNGLDLDNFQPVPEPELSEVRRKLALPQQFVLAVGHLERRKNYLRLLEAIARLRDRGRPCALVIIGNDSGEGGAIREKIASLQLTGTVTLLSGLSDLEVRCAYQLCSVFAFASTYEGFGIPILEAMAARRPMVLSDIAVFKEITEDRSVYFPPGDVEAMAAALDQVLTSESERSRLVAYGEQRVKDFSFTALAGQVAQLYRALA
jgi:glycosyltransferase involved in cell wall biosynthesis